MSLVERVAVDEDDPVEGQFVHLYGVSWSRPELAIEQAENK